MAKRLRRLKSKYLPRFIKNHIKFPKYTFFGNVFRHGLSIVFALLALLASTYIPYPERKTIFYLLFFLAAVLSMLFGGSLSGIVVLAIGVISSYFVIYQFSVSFFPIFEIGLFTITIFLLGVVIDFFRKIPLLDEMNRRDRKYQKTLHELKEAMRKAEKEILMRDEFLSIASHELKTPLTSMLLQIQIALHNIRNVSLANFSVQNLLTMLENAELQTQRLSKMINDLLNVSLITTGKITIEPEETNLSDIVKDVVEKIPSGMNKPDYPIRLDARSTLVGTWDKVRIEQAVSNLISNAMKYGRDNPVEVKLQKSNGHAKLTIKDHGIGIPKHEQTRVFSRFQRGKNSNKNGGLGVGLYITNQIIKAHHGTISLKSKEGKGSTFTVELPIEQ